MGKFGVLMARNKISKKATFCVTKPGAWGIDSVDSVVSTVEGSRKIA
jgi:hypothetical protein